MNILSLALQLWFKYKYVFEFQPSFLVKRYIPNKNIEFITQDLLICLTFDKDSIPISIFKYHIDAKSGHYSKKIMLALGFIVLYLIGGLILFFFFSNKMF
jgi:hypothetical protein